MRSLASGIAGGFHAAAPWLILLALGVGIALSSVSWWSNIGASVSSIGAAAIILDDRCPIHRLVYGRAGGRPPAYKMDSYSY
jgi:hypothetical protein